MYPSSPQSTRVRQPRSSILPPAANVVSEGFIEIVFFLLGIGILLPWNANITAREYFVSRLCEADPVLAQRIEMWFCMLYNMACVLSLAVVILVQHFTNQNDSNTNNSRLSKRTQSFFKSTTNLSIPMMCSKTLRVDATRASSSDRYTWYMVMVPLAVYTTIFAVTTLLVFLDSVPPQIFLVFTLSGLFICGVCTAVASSGIVGTAGLFDASIGVNPYFNGQAAGGLLVACASLFTSVLDGSANHILQYCAHGVVVSESEMEQQDESEICLPYSDISWATAGYFGMSCIILAACMVGYSYIDEYKRLVFTNTIRGDLLYATLGAAGFESVLNVTEEDEDESNEAPNQPHHLQFMSIENLPETGAETDKAESSVSKWKKMAMVSFASIGELEHYNDERTPLQRMKSDSSDDSGSENFQCVTLSVWESVREPAISLFLTYFCTLAIFPVWTSNLRSTIQCQSVSRIRNDLYSPLSFVIFNGGDLVGRSLSGVFTFEKIENLSRKLVYASSFRLLFLLLFLFCLSGSNRYRPWVVESDWYSWIVQFLFAASNGFLTNVCFCFAPSLVENRSHPQQVASAILNFAVSFGLLVGSFSSGPYLQFASGV